MQNFNKSFSILQESKLGIFGATVYSLLVENSDTTYVCGGTTRDIILNEELKDFDISTDLLPNKVLKIFKHNSFFKAYPIFSYPKFGVVKIMFKKSLFVDISTLRKENYKKPSYPQIRFTKSVKIDSNRRDFTVNSLYLKPETGKILDFHKGQNDLQNKVIKFIGNPDSKILEDPFRMVRALRFALKLNFKIERYSWLAIKKHFLIQKLGSKKKLLQEITKLHNQKQQILLNKIIFGKLSLDKFSKKFYDA